MKKLSRDELFTLEKYAESRADFRAEVMAHKQHRRLALGPHLSLYFEDRLTIQYQIQEMLRVERIFEPEAIEEELAAYNPLIPDGSNLKATMMIEFDDREERARRLAEMVDIENKLWLQVAGKDRVYPIADEDLERTTQDKTSAVHFLRFEFDDDMINALKSGAGLSAGVEHTSYSYIADPVPAEVRDTLIRDFD